jgi:hypothetical protein
MGESHQAHCHTMWKLALLNPDGFILVFWGIEKEIFKY